MVAFIVVFVAAFAFGGCAVDDAPVTDTHQSLCEGTPTYLVVRELVFSVEESEGIARGMNLDGLISDDSDIRGCRKADYVSPTGQEGIDNQLGFLVPLVEQTLGNVITGTVQSSINEGSLLIVIGMQGLDDRTADDCVGLSVQRGGGMPLIGTDGLIEPWQTFSLEAEGGQNFAPDASMTEGILLAGPFEFELSLVIQGNPFYFAMKNSWARLELGETGEVVHGMLAGGIDVAALSETLMSVEAGDFARLVVPLLRSEADMAPNEMGRCQQISTAFEFEAVPGFVFE
jgi:hypothetical protein